LARVSIIGSGYTGSLVGKSLEKAGNTVVFYDINEETVSRLAKEGHESTKDIKHAIHGTDISFICVPTPTINGKIDLSYIESATKEFANELKNKFTYHLLVVKSTVVPTTTENFVKPLIEGISGKKCGEGFGLCMSPEFLTQVNKTTKDPELKAWYEKNPDAIKSFEDRAVIGSFDQKSGDILESLLKSINIPIFRTDVRTAEMIKYAHNLNLATRISYWNELFTICNSLGIDSKTVAEVVSQDPRIGKYGTVHGKAFGGVCLPKDLEAFVSFCRKHNINPELLDSVQTINKVMANKHGVRE